MQVEKYDKTIIKKYFSEKNLIEIWMEKNQPVVLQKSIRFQRLLILIAFLEISGQSGAYELAMLAYCAIGRLNVRKT